MSDQFTNSDTRGTKELELAAWLLDNKDVILGHVPKNKNFHFLPHTLYEIYVQNYPATVLKTIKDQITLDLTPAELHEIVTQEWVERLVGKVFKP